jgi:hypothetical protein
VDQQQQQSQADLPRASTSLGPTAPMTPPTRMIDPVAAEQLELTGGDPAELLGRLVSSLRAGLPVTRLRDVAPTLQLPTETEAAALFGPPQMDAPIDSSVQHTEDLPKEAPPTEALTVEASAPDMAGRMVALMVQDMAAFGGRVGPDSVRHAPSGEGYRFDYFA